MYCIMKHILTKYGFTMCGVIYLADGAPRDAYIQKNELRHSRGAPHTNHIINNTKTNNRVQRYGHSANCQHLDC